MSHAHLLKKLEWQKTIDDTFEAEAFEGVYHLECIGDGQYTVEWVFDDSVRTLKDPITGRLFNDDQTAMDQAQLDFERIVCECYESEHEKT